MISPLCYPVAAAESIVNAKLFMTLTDEGYNVDVITRASENHFYLSDGIIFNNVLKQNVISLKYSKGLNYTQLTDFILAKLKTGHYYRGVSWAVHAINVAEQYHKINNYDIIITFSPPSEIVGLYMARKYGLKWIANWNDPYPVKKYPAPYASGLDYRLKAKEIMLLQDIVKYASWHTFPSNRLREYMISYFPEKEHCYSYSGVIPHVLYKNTLPENETLLSIDKHDGEFVIIHTGKLVSPRLPYNFLKGYRKFLDQTTTNSRLVLVGHIDESFANMVKDMGLHNKIDFMGNRSYLNCLSAIKQADVALLIEANCTEGIFLPSKFVDYVQCNKPVICVSPKVGTVNDIVTEYGGGVVADPLNSDDICKKIKLIYEDIIYRNGKNYKLDRLREQFSQNFVISCYKKIFRKILG